MRKKVIVYLICSVAFAAMAAPPSGNSQLHSIKVDGPNIVIRGSHLSRVEVWAVPSGTGITPDAYVLLGNAKRNKSQRHGETWVFAIPNCETDTRLLATEIFAKGFNDEGDAIGKKSLPYVGASAVYEALCPKK